MPRPTIAELSARCDVQEARAANRQAEIDELFKDDEKLLELSSPHFVLMSPSCRRKAPCSASGWTST